MAFDYINEAFKKLELLEEEMFDTSLDGINNMSNFMDSADEVVRVIDPEADTEEDLQDSYVGKVIINCNICHSHVFEDKEDIKIEEDGAVNIEMQCPYCGEQEGFTIVGEITPYVKAEEQTTEEPVEDIANDVDIEDNNIIEESVLGAVGLGLAAGAARAVGDKVTSSLLDDVNDNKDDEVLTEDPDENRSLRMSRVTRRAMRRNKPEEKLEEDFKEVSITTEDQHMEMTSDENGKVTVTTEPVEATEEVSEEPVIAPVSDETKEEILDNNGVETEEPIEEEPIEEEPAIDEDEFDFEEVDEEGMDELGESYLRKVYENVESFKTTSVAANDQVLIVEGVIKFNSGAKKKTGFIFEAKDANTRGQVRFTGSNNQLAESKDAFSLVGRVDNKKLFVESLKYNYKVNEEFVRGLVRRK